MGYIEDVVERKREMRRRSRWVPVNAFFGLFLVVAIFFGGVVGAGRTLEACGSSLGSLNPLLGLLATLPLFFAAVPFGLMASNFVMHAIPPIRRSLESTGSYAQAQAALAKTIIYVSLPALLVSAAALIHTCYR